VNPAAVPVRVLVVDDEPLARAGCRLALEATPGLAVVGEADCGSSVAMAVDRQPDVVVVNGRAPGADALETAERIRAHPGLVETRVIVFAAAQGLSNEAIGRRLHMSPATARTHVSRALTKLGLRDRPQLVVLAYEAGLVTPGADPDTHPLYAPDPPSIAS
jgi:DNA-binding NarL/FixJ family response regulator